MPKPERPAEWIGGRLANPVEGGKSGGPGLSELIVWLERPSGLIVGQDVVGSDAADGALARALQRAFARPMVGRPRRPRALRVANAVMADEVRSIVGETIPVHVAPTPELDALLEAMRGALLEALDERAAVEAPYLDGERFPPSAVGELFAAAELLHSVAPWRVASEEQVLRVDVPAFGVEGACLVVIGGHGEQRGVLLFPSLAGYEAFRDADEDPFTSNRPPDFGSDWLALTFDRDEEVPEALWQEALDHGWPIAGTDAYPRLLCCQRTGRIRPLVERDVAIATACAKALASFVADHEGLFVDEEIEPLCVSYFGADDLEVLLTAPYEAYALFDVAARPAAPPAPRPPERNAPCGCGSGRKYKKCCLRRDEEQRRARRERDAHLDLDREMTARLERFAFQSLGEDWQRRAGRALAALGAPPQLVLPWILHHLRVRERSAAEWFLEDGNAARAPRAERAWFEAQRAAWLSVWEVIEVTPGESLTLRDLLSGETRVVQETRASRRLGVREALLARVVDHEGRSHLGGLHPQPLGPRDAAEVVRRARARLRRKRAVPAARLRDEAIGRFLIRRWQEAIAEMQVRVSATPELQNSDGHPLLLTTDHFAVATGARPAVAARLAALDGVEPPEPGEEPPTFVFLGAATTERPLGAGLGAPLIGQARLGERALVLETNSRERADALRERIEAACGDAIRHRLREHADPLSEKAAPPGPGPAVGPAGHAAEQLLLELERRHYADWPDQELPALGGKTPRQAVRSVKGRDAVDLLLKQMEHGQRFRAGTGRFDVSQLRRDLGLDP